MYVYTDTDQERFITIAEGRKSLPKPEKLTVRASRNLAITLGVGLPLIIMVYVSALGAVIAQKELRTVKQRNLSTRYIACVTFNIMLSSFSLSLISEYYHHQSLPPVVTVVPRIVFIMLLTWRKVSKVSQPFMYVCSACSHYLLLSFIMRTLASYQGFW